MINKSKHLLQRAWIVLLMGVLYIPSVFAGLIFTTEDNAVNSDNFILDFDDTASTFIDLEFGTSLSAKLRYDVLNDKFILNRDLSLTNNLELLGSFKDKDGDSGTAGQILSSTNTGTDWITNTANPAAPFISTGNQEITKSTTQTLTINGANFLPTTTVSIPGFDASVDSYTIISPTELNITLTAGTTLATYNILLSNSGTLNTDWTGNGVGLITVNNPVQTPVVDCAGGFQATSCSILNSSTDGTYCIDPDGAGGTAEYLTYCDMNTDGGGWSRVIRTTGNNTDFGQKNHSYSYVSPSTATGIYETYSKITDFNRVMIKKVGTADFSSYNLVSASAGDSIYDIMTYCKGQSEQHSNDTIWDGTRLKGMTSEYSGTKTTGTLNFGYFFMCGVNESSDNDQAYMSFSDSTGSSNSWGDSWRGTSQAGTLWSLQNGDYYTTSNTHIGNGYSQAGAGYKGGNNGTYEVYIK